MNNLGDISFSNCNQNSAQNFNRVDLGVATLWFSYETIVAFCTPQTGMCVTENVWGPTTGKHLNWISDKENRLPRQEYLDKLNSIKLSIELVSEVKENE